MTGEPAEHWAVEVHRAALPDMVILQAEIAPWDGANPTPKDFVVKPWVCD